MAQQTGSSSSGGAGALPRILLLNPNTNTGMTESMAAVARSTPVSPVRFPPSFFTLCSFFFFFFFFLVVYHHLSYFTVRTWSKCRGKIRVEN